MIMYKHSFVIEHIIRSIIIFTSICHLNTNRATTFTHALRYFHTNPRTIYRHCHIFTTFNKRNSHFISIIAREINGRSIIQKLTHNSDKVSGFGQCIRNICDTRHFIHIFKDEVAVDSFSVRSQHPDGVSHRFIFYFIRHRHTGRNPECQMGIAHISGVVFRHL